jgi:hypothetical protein
MVEASYEISQNKKKMNFFWYCQIHLNYKIRKIKENHEFYPYMMKITIYINIKTKSQKLSIEIFLMGSRVFKFKSVCLLSHSLLTETKL